MATFPGGVEINPAASAIPGAINNAVNLYQVLEQAAMMKRKESWEKDIGMFDYAIKAASIKGLSPETKAKVLQKGFGAMNKWGFETPDIQAGQVEAFEPLVKNYQNLREAVQKGDISSDAALKEWRGQLANWHASQQEDQTGREKLFEENATKSFGDEEAQKTTKDTTDALRKEFTSLPQMKDFQTVAASFQKIRAGSKQDSAAGDLSLIFSYMKLLDPGSVVREGEFATAQNTAGVPDRVRAQYNRIVSGERLTTNQRKDFLQTATTIYKSQEKYVAGIEDQYKKVAQSRGIDPSMVLLNLRAPEEDMGAMVPAASAPTGMPRPGGQQVVPTRGPRPGSIEEGHKFIGGNPSDPKNWVKLK